MNYEHFYHAGSSADVFKHLTLMALLSCLTEKDKPFCYIDTHAGSGEYHLAQSSAHQEWQTGIGILRTYKPDHFLLKQYLDDQKDLQHFKGSPAIAKKWIRQQDEIILVEKSETAYQRLKKNFPHNKHIHIHHADAYFMLNALLPPRIKRGLILIDPPYEEKHEFEKLTVALKSTHKKFPTGIIALWYPIKSRQRIQDFYQILKKQMTTPITIAEFCPWPDDIAIRLNGSGMLIINPPYRLNSLLPPVLDELITILRQHPKGFVVYSA